MLLFGVAANVLLFNVGAWHDSGFPRSESEHPGFVSCSAANLPELRADVRAVPERLSSSRGGRCDVI